MKRSRAKCEPLVGINNNNQQLAPPGTMVEPTQLVVSTLDNKAVNKRQHRGGGGSLASTSSSTSSSSGDQSGTANKPVQQRNAANARERQRMRVLSKAFCRLKTSLPWVPPDTKLSKLDTLRLASCYIAHLKQILDDDQTPGSVVAPKSTGRPGKQSSAVLSAVSASTSKLLSMALPLAANNNLQTASSRSQQFPTSHPIMSWPFASRTVAPSSNNNNNGANRVPATSGGAKPSSSSNPRQVGGQLGQLYAQFKDRLLVLPNHQQQQQPVSMATQQFQKFPSPTTASCNNQQVFATPPSSTSSWSNFANNNSSSSFCSPPAYQQQQQSMYSVTPPNNDRLMMLSQNQPRPNCYYGNQQIFEQANSGNFFQSSMISRNNNHHQRHQTKAGLIKTVAPTTVQQMS